MRKALGLKPRGRAPAAVTAAIVTLNPESESIDTSSNIDSVNNNNNNSSSSSSAFRTEAEDDLNDDEAEEQWKVSEIMIYFTESFGNSTRIDYGTGHEASFIAWMCCLACLGLFRPEDKVALVSRLFKTYLELTRGLQKQYNLEPAGSHGVWGLDDFQFVSFIWGSAQLIGELQL